MIASLGPGSAAAVAVGGGMTIAVEAAGAVTGAELGAVAVEALAEGDTGSSFGLSHAAPSKPAAARTAHRVTILVIRSPFARRSVAEARARLHGTRAGR